MIGRKPSLRLVASLQWCSKCGKYVHVPRHGFYMFLQCSRISFCHLPTPISSRNTALFAARPCKSWGLSLSLSPSLSIMGWHPKLQTRWSPTAVEKRSHTTPRVCNAVKHIIRFTKPRPWQCARLPQRGNRRAAALAGGVWMCRGESVLLLWQSIY